MRYIAMILILVTTSCGTQGEQGRTGKRGDQGEPGDTGQMGADGTPGERGEQGETGRRGRRGKAGKDAEGPIYKGYYCSRVVYRIAEVYWIDNGNLQPLGTSWYQVRTGCSVRIGDDGEIQVQN